MHDRNPPNLPLEHFSHTFFCLLAWPDNFMDLDWSQDIDFSCFYTRDNDARVSRGACICSFFKSLPSCPRTTLVFGFYPEVLQSCSCLITVPSTKFFIPIMRFSAFYLLSGLSLCQCFYWPHPDTARHSYFLDSSYSGSTFFNDWNFFTVSQSRTVIATSY